MRTRTLARQKARADNKARLKQAQLERHKMATQPAQIEERNFTAAEMELFSVKYAEYQKMANAVNELLAFLKKQHDIKDGEGWQLGERGFVRAARAEDAPAAKPKRSRPARAAKKTADLPALGQGENVATVAQNGQLATEPVV